MSRPINLIPCVPLKTHLPIDLRTRLDLHLFSEVEGRVPKGAYQRLLTKLLTQFFEGRTLDLAPYVSALPEVYVVSGTPQTLEVLKTRLENGGKL